VTKVDSDDAANGANGQYPTEHAEPGVIVDHKNVATPEQHAEPDRHHQQGKPAIQLFLGQCRHFQRLVRIGGVLADDVVQNRDDPEDGEIDEPGPVILSAGFAAGQRAQRQDRQQCQPEQRVTHFLDLQHDFRIDVLEHDCTPHHFFNVPLRNGMV